MGTVTACVDQAAAALDSCPATSRTLPATDGEHAERRPPPAALLARYEELRCIGEGAMGTVFRARDPRLGRLVALKLLKSDDPTDTRRFLAEARAQARVQHDNVCRVYEVGEADGEPYIAMELIDGVPLDQASAGMSLEQKVKVIREVAAALQEAHRLGLIHRDVKPGNIMVVTAEDGSYKPYVVDFGLAREVSRINESIQNGIAGTPAYMSPEQAAANSALLDRRSDVYSLGATLYELIAGRTPFVGTNALTLLTQVMFDDPPALGSVCKGVPQQLATIVMKCLQHDPARRYESARALGDDLQRFLDGRPVEAKRPPLTYVLWQKAKKNKALVAVASIGLCIALVLGGMWIRAAQHAAKQAELARVLGEDVKYVELFLRSAYGFPTHDIAREERVVRARLVDIEQRMVEAGRAGEGPGHYALGRAHVALHEYEAARTHLERALAAGFTRPEVHYALGLALGGRYQEELDAARRIEDQAARAAATKKAEATFRDPALRHLRDSGGTQVESKAYIDGLVALYEKRYDVAASHAVAATEESPWLHEARKLEGDARFEAAMVASEVGDKGEARRLFLLAIEAYQAGTAMASSDAALHEALAEAWTQVLVLDAWASRSYSSAFEAALSSCGDAIESNPRIATPFARKGRVYFHVGNHQFRSGADPRPTLQRAIESGRMAHELKSDDAISMDGIGNALTLIAEYERKIGFDPRPTLEQALRNFDEAAHIQPAFAWAWNDAGVALLVRADYENAGGFDPLPSIDAAIERFERAVKEDAAYTLAHGNIIYGLTIRANHEIMNGRDPRAAVQRGMETCARGMAIDPKSILLLNNCGWVELVRAQYEEAIDADPSTTLDRVEASFQASLDLNKDEADTHFGMGSAKRIRALYQIRRGIDAQKYLEEAGGILRHAAGLNAQEPAIRLELGLLTMSMGQRAVQVGEDPAAFFHDAERILREGLRINPRHAPLHAALAELLALRAERMGRKNAERDELLTLGLAAADKSLEHNPKGPVAMAAKGTNFAVRARSRDGAAAAEDTRRAVEWLEKAFATNALLPPRFMERLENVRIGPQRHGSGSGLVDAVP